jgi:tetratricopeptide (TPR) repeat protein
VSVGRLAICARRCYARDVSDLHVARCLEHHGARARFEIVTVHPDAMGRGYPFSISPFFVLHLLFEVVMDAHREALPPYEAGDARDLAVLALASQVLAKVEVVSTANENISEDAFATSFDAIEQDPDDEGASFLDQESRLPRAVFDVDVTDPRLLAGLPVGKSWWSTAYAAEPKPGSAPPAFVIDREAIPPRFPGDVIRAELTAPPRSGTKAWNTPRTGDSVAVTIWTPGDTRSCNCVVLDTEVRGTARKRGAARWMVTEVWIFLEGTAAGLDGDWIGMFQHEVDHRYSASRLMPALARRVGDASSKLASGSLQVGDAARANGATDSAIAWYTRALALALPADPGHGKALFLRASIRAELGDHRAALADWTQLLAEKPDHHGALMGSARTRIRLGEPASTLPELRRAVELGIDDAAELLRAHTPAPSASSQRVSHAKFGEGVILRRLPGDKLEIEFGAGGTKILLERFVKPIT